MALFDINGKEIVSSGSATVTQAQIVSAIASGMESGEIVLPTTTVSGTLSLGALASYTDWLDGVRNAFDAMMADYQKDEVDGIPLFLCADLHGSSYEVARIPHNYDNTVFSIVLGDLCGDYYNTTQIAAIKTAHKPIKSIVSVVGNHDIITKTSSDARSSYHALNGAFICTDAKRPDNLLYHVVYDKLHGCKYVTVSGYRTKGAGYSADSYERKIGTAQMAWLIEELSRNDGYDIVVLSHEPVGSSWVNREGETTDDAGYGYYSGIRSILAARKVHASGTVTDADGVEHSYDFSDTTTECLCSFHGHLHSELYSQADGWTEYIEQQYSLNVDGCVSWALIDRNAMTLTIYKAGQDNLVLNL